MPGLSGSGGARLVPPGHDGPMGVVVVDKEPGWTSHDVVARCRRLFGQRRVGHAGTLDPDATGVLIIGLGRATRLLRYITGLPKTYVGEVALGTATSTLDSSGAITGAWDMSSVTYDAVCAAAAGLTGDIEQIPPMVSALKVGGRRLHAMAREGIEIDRPARSVKVHRFEVGPQVPGEEGVYPIEVDCSTGTYIRSLADDLGRALGGGAHLRNLRRTRIGSFGVAEAHTIAELGTAHVLTPAQALRDMEQVEVGSELARLVVHGLALDKVAIGASGGGPWALVDAGGRLLAVYEATPTERVTAAVVIERS